MIYVSADLRGASVRRGCLVDDDLISAKVGDEVTNQIGDLAVVMAVADEQKRLGPLDPLITPGLRLSGHGVPPDFELDAVLESTLRPYAAPERRATGAANGPDAVVEPVLVARYGPSRTSILADRL
jgi:hypothetical protein